MVGKVGFSSSLYRWNKSPQHRTMYFHLRIPRTGSWKTQGYIETAYKLFMFLVNWRTDEKRLLVFLGISKFLVKTSKSAYVKRKIHKTKVVMDCVMEENLYSTETKI